jgi:hypothetical protein
MVPFPVLSYRDHHKLLLTGEDMRLRVTRWVRSILVHNTKNIEPVILPGAGPHMDIAEKLSLWWSRDKSHAGAHLVIDWDGAVAQLCDLLQHTAYHASQLNEVSIGIEVFQDREGHVYAAQMEALAMVLLALTRIFGIQRQMPIAGQEGPLPCLMPPRNGRTAVGIFGHSNCSPHKESDPGAATFRYLRDTGNFMTFDYLERDDLAFWREVQRCAGVEADGIPGPYTVDALQAAGYPHGLWPAATVLNRGDADASQKTEPAGSDPEVPE